MPDFFQNLLNKQYEAIIFLIQKDWENAGQVEDFHKANEEHEKILRQN
jgi:dTDP-glucose pyrophosphorylase